MMDQEEMIKKFKDAGAMLNGHFKFTSGLHSDTYIQCAQVMQYPEFIHNLCSELGKRFKGNHVDVIVGPAVGAVIMAYVMARVMGPWVRTLFTERENGEMTLRRSFKIEKGEKVIVVEDVITTGGSVKEVMELVKQRGGEVIGVAALVDRSGGNVNLGVKTETLINVKMNNYEPNECPLCKKEIPLIEPGSRHLKNKVA